MTHKVTQKMKHLESISEMLYTLRILTDHSNHSIGYSKRPNGWCLREPKEDRRTWDLTHSVLPFTYHTPTVNVPNSLNNIPKFSC